ncbi:MAG TPA: GNAT family N-acetyltransferase [Solirubrobacteraceae bacterium]
MTATTAATLTDARVALLRPLDSSDRERIVAAFDRLSEESRYRRFFAPLLQLSDRSLEYLTDIDHSDHEGIIALDPGTDELIGVARYVRGEPGSDRAEAAVVVADDWQHVGLGRALLERLVARAHVEDIWQVHRARPGRQPPRTAATCGDRADLALARGRPGRTRHRARRGAAGRRAGRRAAGGRRLHFWSPPVVGALAQSCA